jgi:multidrug efflux pump subunit AcrB
MIEFLVDRKRTALAILVVLIFAGIFGRANIPIESEPEIVVPGNLYWSWTNGNFSSRC